MIAEHGDADVPGAVMLVTGKKAGLGECGKDLLAHDLRLGGGFLGTSAQIFQYHDKLVAPQAGYGVVRAYTGKKPPGDLLQQQVADIVAQRVVDGLEVVQIDEEDCPPPPAASGRRQCLLQPVQQEPSVGQLGQRIVKCQMFDLLLGCLALGDVNQRTDVVCDLSVA